MSTDGYLHLLVAICYLSKYVIARPLKSKRSCEVIDQLRSIYLTLGTPEIIQHDQGPEFKILFQIVYMYVFQIKVTR